MSGANGMNLYRLLAWPVLSQTDPEWAHERTLQALALAQSTPAGRLMLRQIRGALPARPVVCAGLTFPNPIGVAAGFDKDARVVRGLAELGFGHIEVGTLTPAAQPGNPRPRLFRLPADDALINRLGFPNQGVAAVLPRLRQLAQQPRPYRIGVSLGKQKETSLEQAVDDYVTGLRQLYPYADYIAINVSSPNTPGLRDLQGPAYLQALLSALANETTALARQHGHPCPLWLKIAPDLSWSQLDDILQVATDQSVVAGLIAVNTTIDRTGLHSSHCQQAGGVSGRPLQTRSNAIIRHIHACVGDRLPIIGVGGVFQPDDVRAKLDAGATLVQLYTGLVYEGPAIAGRLVRALATTPSNQATPAGVAQP